MSEQDRIEAAAEAIYNTSSYSDQDRAEFTRLVNAWEQAILARHHDPCELWQGECQQILADLKILVFGEEIDDRLTTTGGAPALPAPPPTDPTTTLKD
jgi:hypothetical protein